MLIRFLIAWIIFVLLGFSSSLAAESLIGGVAGEEAYIQMPESTQQPLALDSYFRSPHSFGTNIYVLSFVFLIAAGVISANYWQSGSLVTPVECGGLAWMLCSIPSDCALYTCVISNSPITLSSNSPIYEYEKDVFYHTGLYASKNTIVTNRATIDINGIENAVGMGAVAGGVAVNDTMGVIMVSQTLSPAMYAHDAFLVNDGTIILDSAPASDPPIIGDFSLGTFGMVSKSSLDAIYVSLNNGLITDGVNRCLASYPLESVGCGTLPIDRNKQLTIGMKGLGSSIMVNGHDGYINADVGIAVENFSYGYNYGTITAFYGMYGQKNSSLYNMGTIVLSLADFVPEGIDGGTDPVLHDGDDPFVPERFAAMTVDSMSTAVNFGTIVVEANAYNVYRAYGMQALNNSTVYNYASGTIIVNTRFAYAFYADASSAIFNAGIIICNTGFDCLRADPDGRDISDDGTPCKPCLLPSPGLPPSRAMENYVAMSSADGSVGQYIVLGGHADVTGMKVDSGFSLGTADKSFTLQGVAIADSYDGLDTITATSVVWKAEPYVTDSDILNVTMHKVDYELLADSDTLGIARVLENSYQGGAFYHSLNVGDIATFNDALRQVSGLSTYGITPMQFIFGVASPLILSHSPLDRQMPFGFSSLLSVSPSHGSVSFTPLGEEALTTSFAYGFTHNQQQFSLRGLYGLTPASSSLPNMGSVFSLTFGMLSPLADNLFLNTQVHTFYGNLQRSRTLDYDFTHEKLSHQSLHSAFVVDSQLMHTFSHRRFDFSPYLGMQVAGYINGGFTETGSADFALTVDTQQATQLLTTAGLRGSLQFNDSTHLLVFGTLGYKIFSAGDARVASLATGEVFTLDPHAANIRTTVGFSYEQAIGAFSFASQFLYMYDGQSALLLQAGLRYAF